MNLDSRRQATVVGVTVAGTGLLGWSLSTKPDSRAFYVLTAGVAGTWVLGGAATRSGEDPAEPATPWSTVPAALATGVAAFGAFYGAALVARRIPVLNRALTSVLHYAHQGSDLPVYLTTLANGIGEEVFFRGGAFDTFRDRRPVATTTALYVASTIATRNPALVLASGVMGTLFAEQRRRTGGLIAPTVTHLSWSALMLRFLPPLFPPTGSGSTGTGVGTSRG